MNNARTAVKPNKEVPSKTTAGDIPANSGTLSIPNSDCPGAMEDESFESLYADLLKKDDDDRRFSFLIKNIPGNCYNTVQASLLAREISSEEMRFSFLKKIYPRISDQHHFNTLHQLFDSAEWKEQFLSIK